MDEVSYVFAMSARSQAVVPEHEDLMVFTVYGLVRGGLASAAGMHY